MTDYTLRLVVDGDSSGGVSALQSATGALNSFGGNAMKAGGILSAGLTLPLVALGKGALEAGTKLNAAMANIGSMGIAIPRVNELKKSIQDLSIATGKTTDDLAKGTYQIISAYGDSADTAKILALNTKVAAAGVASLSDTVGAIAIVTKNWGDTTVAAQGHVGDQLLKTVALGQTTLPELASSLGAVAPAAHAAGISTNEMFAAIATGAGVTGNTSEVITQLNGVLAAFMKPGNDMKDLLKQNGYASGEAALKALGLQGAMKMIEVQHEKSGESVASFTKRIEGARLVLALAGTSSKTYQDNLKQLGNVAGTTDMAYDAQTNGVNKAGFAMEVAKAKMQVFLQKINDGMGPALLAFTDLVGPLVDKLMGLADTFTALDPSTQKWIVGIAAGAAAIGPLLLGVGSLAKAIAFFMPFAAGMASALLPITIALGVGYAAYKLNLFGLKDLVDSGFKRIQAAAPLAGDALKSVWKQFTGSREDIGKGTVAIHDFMTALTGSDTAGLAAVNWVTGLATKIQNLKSAYNEAGGGAAGFVAGFQNLTGIDLTPLLGKFKTVIGEIRTSFTEVFSGDISIGQFVGKLSAALAGIPGMLTTLFAGTDFTSLKTQIVSALGIDNISLDMTALGGKISTAVTTAMGKVDFSTITADFKQLTAWVSLKLSLLDWSSVTTTFSTLTTWVSTKLSALDWSGVTLTFSTFTTWVSGQLSKVDFTSVTGAFTGFTTVVTGFDTSLKGLTAQGGGLTQLQTMILGAVKGISDTINGIDANQVASVGLSFSASIKSVLDMFTTLSGIGGVELTTETKAISDIAKSVLGLATSFTTGLDATGVSDSAAKFVTSYVNKLNAAFSVVDLPGIAESASGLLAAITGQFSKAMGSSGPSTVGASLGNFANTIIAQLGATLSDAKFAAQLGVSFGNVGTGIINGITGAFKGFNETLNKNQDGLAPAINGFVSNFMGGLTTGLANANYGEMATAIVKGIGGALGALIGASPKQVDAANQKVTDAQTIANTAAQKAVELQKIANTPGATDTQKQDALVANQGKFLTSADAFLAENKANQTSVLGMMGNLLKTGVPTVPQGPIQANNVTVTANTATLPSRPVDNSIRTSNDFSTALSELNSLKPLKVEDVQPLKVEAIPPVAAPVIPPLQAPVIPPVQVAQPSWFSSLMSWIPPLPFGIGHNASGTDNWQGGWTWVGENGPELLNLPGSSKIISNDKSKKMIGHMAGGNYDVPFSPNPYMGPYAPQPFINNPFGAPGPTSDRLLLPLTQLTENAVPALKEISKNTANTHKTLVNTAIKAQAHDPQQSARDKAALAQKGLPANDPLLKTFSEMQKAGIEITKAFKGTIQEFKGFLQKVPGLFGASSVTSEDMAAAKAGTYQPKADEKLRQLKDLAEHGVHYAGLNVQDFKDALGRIGIKASDDLKTLTEQVTSAWNDQSLFSSKQNIASLIDIKAVKASITEQKTKADQSAAGNANLLSLFGLAPDAATTQATALGKQARQSLQTGFTGAVGATGKGAAGTAAGGLDLGTMLGGASVTPESVAPLAASFMTAFGKALTPQKDKNGKSTGVDFGALFASAINDSIAISTAFNATGSTILTKITGSFKDVKGVDFVAGIVSALGVNLSAESSIKALNNVGQRIAQILKQGIADGFKTTDVAAAVNNGVKPGSTSSPAAVVKLPGNASGTDFWRGGLTTLDERGGEIVDLPRGSRIYPHDVSQKMAGAGDTHIHINATVNTPLDIEKIAYRVSQIQMRRGR